MISKIYRYMPDFVNRKLDSYEEAYSHDYCIVINNLDDEVCMVKFSDGTMIEALCDELEDVSFNGNEIAVISKE